MMAILEKIVVESWTVLTEMAPWLLLGFLVAGVFSVLISPAWIERHLGRGGFLPVFKASLFGVPLPLCSCGVIPVSASMRRHGASRAATISFLLSTPQTGVDSIAATYAVLGPVIAVFRPLVALLTGLLGGAMVLLLGETDDPAANGHRNGVKSCAEACCAADKPRNRALAALHYGLLTLPRDLFGALLLGTLIAGAIAALVPQGALQPYLGGGVVAMLAMMALGIPLYVCATGSVPIAAGFMYLGASPGAALAFLISGPATNAATLTTVWRLLGKRTALVYLASIALVAITAGLVLDGLFAAVVPRMPALAAPSLGAHAHHAAAIPWTGHAWAAALLVVMFASRAAGWWKKSEAPQTPQSATEGEDRIELHVGGMNCAHCQASVHEALAACPGVASVRVTLAPGGAVVRGKGLDGEALAEAVRRAGFTAAVCE